MDPTCHPLAESLLLSIPRGSRKSVLQIAFLEKADMEGVGASRTPAPHIYNLVRALWDLGKEGFLVTGKEQDVNRSPVLQSTQSAF